MADLTFHNALTTIEKALKNQILLALGARITPAAATVSALRTFNNSNSTALRSDELIFCTAKGFTYQFNRTSTASDDGDLVICPADNPAAGRWLKTTSTVPTGYAKAVRVHVGDESYQTMLKRGHALRPSLHIVFDDVTYYDRSILKGALYWCIATYRVMAISSNLRNQAQDVEGSDIPAEATADPGTHDMIGDVIATVVGTTLGGITGVAYCETGPQKFHTSDLGGRLIVEETVLKIYYSIQQTDSDLVKLDSLGAFAIQYQSLDGTPYDANNLVLSGYTVPIGAGFTKTPAPGTAKISGAAVSSSPAAHTFSANVDTYRDLNANGTFTYQAVEHNTAAPSVTPDALRVGVTVTDGTGVIWDRLLGANLINHGPVDIAPGAGVGVTSIAVSPSSASSVSGSTVQFTCTATYANGSTINVSNIATWTSSAPSVATVDYTGKATLVSTGSTNVSATLGLLASNTATLTGT